MNRRQRNWIDLTIVIILVIGIAVYLVWQERKDWGIQGKLQYFNEVNERLMIENDAKDSMIDTYRGVRDEYADSVLTLKKALAQKEKDYDILLADKEVELESVGQIKPEVVYDKLQVYYPDTAKIKPYSFSLIQIQGIYATSIESSYQKWQIVSLNEQLSLTSALIAHQDSILANDDLIISTLASKQLNFVSVIGNKDEEIRLLGKKIKRTPIKIGVAGLVGVVVGFLFAK